MTSETLCTEKNYTRRPCHQFGGAWRQASGGTSDAWSEIQQPKTCTIWGVCGHDARGCTTLVGVYAKSGKSPRLQPRSFQPRRGGLSGMDDCRGGCHRFVICHERLDERRCKGVLQEDGETVTCWFLRICNPTALSGGFQIPVFKSAGVQIQRNKTKNRIEIFL